MPKDPKAHPADTVSTEDRAPAASVADIERQMKKAGEEIEIDQGGR